MKFFAPLLLLLILGCTSALRGDLRVPKSMPAEQSRIVRKALDAWCEATNGAVGCHWLESAGGTWHVKIDALPDGVAGRTKYGRGVIIIRPEVVSRPKWFYGILLHEIGHAAGIKKHTPSGLMSEGQSVFCIDKVALDAMCRVVKCGPNRKSEC